MIQEHPLQSIARLSWQPTLLALATAVTNFITTIFIADIGLSAMEVATVVGNIAAIQLCMYMAVGTSLRYFTAAERSKSRRSSYIVNGMFLSGIGGLVLGVLAVVLSMELFGIYGLHVGFEERLYLDLVGGSCMVPAVYEAIRGGLSGVVEQQKSITKAGLLLNVAKLVLSYVLVARLDLGLSGAACALVVSSLLGLCWILVLFRRWSGASFSWRLDWGMQKELLRKGAGYRMLGAMCNQFRMMYVFSYLVRTVGPETLEAYRITNVVQSVAYYAWLSGVIATIGPAVGTRAQDDRVMTRYLKWALGSVVVLTAVLWLVQLLLAPDIVRLFTDDVTIAELAVFLLLVQAGTSCLWAVFECSSEVFGLHKMVKTPCLIFVWGCILLVVSCELVQPSAQGVAYIELGQYVFAGAVTLAYLCGYYKRAGITILSFGVVHSLLRQSMHLVRTRLTNRQLWAVRLCDLQSAASDRVSKGKFGESAKYTTEIGSLQKKRRMDHHPYANTYQADRLERGLNKLYSIRRSFPAWSLINEAICVIEASLIDTMAAIEAAGEQSQFTFVHGENAYWGQPKKYVEAVKRLADKRAGAPLQTLEEIRNQLIAVQMLHLPGVDLQKAITLCSEEDPAAVAV